MQKSGRKKNKTKKISKSALLNVQGSLPRMAATSSHLGKGQSEAPRIIMLDLPLSPKTAVSAAGALSSQYSIDISNVPQFSTRFGSTFVEYRIIGARIHIRQTSQTSASGIVAAYIDEKSGAAPTASDALDHNRVEINAETNTSDKVYRIDWVARDLLDLNFTQISTTFTPVYLKMFQDTANFFGGGAATFIISGSARFEFRGLK